MASVHDVAAYILRRVGALTAMKLHKLAYYSHAWHLVWEERPLFDARIEAWSNGPVIRELYDGHRGTFAVEEWPLGDPDRLDGDERSTVDAVLEFYGDKSAHELSQLTHHEEPWRRARGDLPEGARSTSVISDADLHEYYDGLTRTQP